MNTQHTLIFYFMLSAGCWGASYFVPLYAVVTCIVLGFYYGAAIGISRLVEHNATLWYGTFAMIDWVLAVYLAVALRSKFGEFASGITLLMGFVTLALMHYSQWDWSGVHWLDRNYEHLMAVLNPLVLALIVAHYIK